MSDYDFQYVAGGTHAFESVAALRPVALNVVTGSAEKMRTRRISRDFFKVVQTEPAVGRSFANEEYRTSANVAIISDALWQRHFAGDRSVLGRTMTVKGALDATEVLNVESLVIVGVMPPNFELPLEPASRKFDVLIPYDVRPGEFHRVLANVVGRLRPGATPASAEQEMNTIRERLYGQSRTRPEPFSARLLRDESVSGYSTAFVLLFAASGFVLLMTVTNVAALFLSQGAKRAGELALREALGASRGRLMQDLLLEALLLSCGGGAAALVLSDLILTAARAILPPEVPGIDRLQIDVPAFVFTFGVALLTGLLCTGLSAMRLARRDLNGLLRGEMPGLLGSRRFTNRTLSTLVACQIAFAYVLLVGAGLMIRSYASLNSVDLGFDASRILIARTYDIAVRYPEQRARWTAFFQESVSRIRALPGVRSAVFSQRILVESSPNPMGIRVRNEQLLFPFNIISEGYFRTLGIPLVAGRDFTSSDDDRSTRVAIVSLALSRKIWPNEEPIGKEIGPYTVIGVAGDVREQGAFHAPPPMLYLSNYQHTSNGVLFIKTTSSNPYSVASAVTQELRRLDPDFPTPSYESMDSVVANSVASQKFGSSLLGLFAVFALALAGTGVYGVTAHLAQQRVPEIGIRVALGATRTQALYVLLRHGMRLTAAGIAAGLAGAYLLSRFLAVFLFGVQPADPVSFAAGAAILGLIALASTAIPSYKVSGIDPNQYIRRA